MGRILHIILLIGSIALLPACKSRPAEEPTIYTCPMHPQVQQDHPGTCPFCHMDLEKKVEAADLENEEELKALAEEVNRTVTGNFATTYPKKREAADSLSLDGLIGLDERNINTVSARVSGRIEKLYVQYENQPVKKGQPLFDLYSDELQNAQRDFLSVLNDRDESLMKAMRSKLINLGMNPSELAGLEKTRKVLPFIRIYSPYEGINHLPGSATTLASPATSNAGGMGMGATSKELMPSSSSEVLRQGMYVSKGQTVFQLASHGRLWALLAAHSNEIAQLKQGDPVRISFPATGRQSLAGKIDFIQPYQGDEEQTLTLRVYLQEQADLKVGMLIKGKLKADEEPSGTLFVPQSAVYDLGKSKVVWVANKTGTSFKARKVETGSSAEGWTAINGGLNADEKVAVTAAYLVDSDSFINY